MTFRDAGGIGMPGATVFSGIAATVRDAWPSGIAGIGAATAIAGLQMASSTSWGQYSCEEPRIVVEGVNLTATLQTLPSYLSSGACSDAVELHHAVYHSFRALEDGWYSASVLSSASAAWAPSIVAAAACDGELEEIFGGGMYVSVDDEGGWCVPGGATRLASVTFELRAGESRILVIGGATDVDAGPANLLIERLGSTPMEGAQALFVGSNEFTVAPLAPAIPFEGVCDRWHFDRMNNASRFTFTPPRSGTYQIGFCDTLRYQVALSSSPNFPAEDLLTAGNNCPGTGGRLAAAMEAGVTYYIVAGHDSHFQGCIALTASVEYVDRCPADLTEDRLVDGIDLGMLLLHWGTGAGDITGDGITDGLDISFLIGAWGPCPE